MANAKISQLPAEVAIAGASLAVVVQDNVTSQTTVDDLFTDRTLVNPTLTSPQLGTPDSGTLTNCTGLPIVNGTTGTLSVARGGTGITAFGTGVATALGQNVNGSGAISLTTSPTFVTPTLGVATATTVNVTNIKANDGTAAATIADSTGVITVSTELNVDNLNLKTNTLSSTDVNGNIILAPNGTGQVQAGATTSTTGTYEPVVVASTLSGVGVTGGRSKFSTTINAAAGSYTNAVKANVTYGASGKTTGLGSSLNAEMTLSAGTVDGNYAPIEIELNVPSGASTGTQTALVYASVNDADAATMDTNGVFVNLAGLTPGATDSTKMVTAPGAAAALTPTLGIKIKIGSNFYYIPLVTQANFTKAS